MSDIFNKSSIFYFLVFVIIALVFFTHPFLRYPYDMFYHLQVIDFKDFSHAKYDGKTFLWHQWWSNIFKVVHIPPEEIFKRAYIIHYTQTLISIISIFYFSKVIIRNIFKKISQIDTNYLALFATLIWITIFATFSVHYHQVWLLWYSISYQITLPLTFLLTAITISIIFENNKNYIKLFQAMLIMVLIYLILSMHAAEFIYYILYLITISLVFIDKIFFFFKRRVILSVTFLLILAIALPNIVNFVQSFSYRKIKLLQYLSSDKLPTLYNDIMRYGNDVYSHFNRANSNFNELMQLSILLITIMTLFVIYDKFKQKREIVSIRLFLFLLITTLFIYIPLTKFTAGVASLLTYTRLVHRFYFSSTIFLVIPIVVYYFFKRFNIKNSILEYITTLLILISTLIYSKYYSQTHNYYKNIISIKNSFHKERVGFNLKEKDIKLIKKELNYYKNTIKTTKPLYFYARDDIAFVLKFIYRERVYYFRRGKKEYKQDYYKNRDKNLKKGLYPVLFKTPNSISFYKKYY